MIRILTAILLLPSAAFAAEGMPQLDFKNPLLISQVVWGAIIFIVLYVLLSRWALPQVGAVLATREARINADLDTARASKLGADAAVAELTTATAKARAEANTAINDALEQAKREAAIQTAELNARLETQTTAAEARIGEARASGVAALRQVATETANTVITRLTGQPADPARVASTVGSLLAARGQGG